MKKKLVVREPCSVLKGGILEISLEKFNNFRESLFKVATLILGPKAVL